jgi:hypothetical protein
LNEGNTQKFKGALTSDHAFPRAAVGAAGDVLADTVNLA